MSALWGQHPAVRTDGDLTRGERAADRMRTGMGSWWFVFGALGFLVVWIGAAEAGWIDNPQLTILNLVLSCVAALQGAILLIAARRADQIASELARHDYDTDVATAQLVERIAADVAVLKTRPCPFHDQAGDTPATSEEAS